MSISLVDPPADPSGGGLPGYINESKCLATPFAPADCDFAPACAHREGKPPWAMGKSLP
jgi:hypothetical protein